MQLAPISLLLPLPSSQVWSQSPSFPPTRPLPPVVRLRRTACGKQGIAYSKRAIQVTLLFINPNDSPHCAPIAKCYRPQSAPLRSLPRRHTHHFRQKWCVHVSNFTTPSTSDEIGVSLAITISSSAIAAARVFKQIGQLSSTVPTARIASADSLAIREDNTSTSA